MADDQLDKIVNDNPKGIALFTSEDGESFVNGKLVASVYQSLTLIGSTSGSLDTAQLANLSYLLAAIESRSRGERLLDEMTAKLNGGGI
jgi:hypothetical protein